MRRFALAACAALFLGGMLHAQTDAQKAAAAAAAAISQTPETVKEAPKPVYWKYSLKTQLNFAQTSYTNWAKGGNDNVAFTSFIDANANYAKDNVTWNNRLQLDYGFLYSSDKPILQKSKDRMLLESTFGVKATDKLNYAAKFTFLNQFTRGYTYGTPSGTDPTVQDWLDARALKSGFLSPGIATLGFGIDWVPNKALSLNLSPLTGGFTVVTIEDLRKNNGMKLRKKYENETAPIGSMYSPLRFDLGAQITADFKLKVNDNFDAQTHLILFSNYLDNPLKPRINWDNMITWRLAKYFTLTFTTNLIYDHTVLIPDENGTLAPRVQFLESVLFGFTYTFSK